jgi:UDP-N-acetylmuramate dehydrogenase
MQLQQNVSLKPYNTFGIDVPAEYFTDLENPSQLEELGAVAQTRHVLGGGSNILLTQPVKGLVIRNLLKGITTEREDDEHIWLQYSRARYGTTWCYTPSNAASAV